MCFNMDYARLYMEMTLVYLQWPWASTDNFQGKWHCEFCFWPAALQCAEQQDSIKMFGIVCLERSSYTTHWED